MAISPVTGTLFNETSSVTSFTVPYAPTAGNGLIISVLLHGPAVNSLQDNLGNAYTPDTTFGSSAVYHISSAASGITGFTVTGASAATGVVAIQEYSGQAGILYLGGAGSTTSQTGKSGNDNGDYLVAVAISGGAITSITNATSRQNGGNNADFIEIGDAGPESPNTSVTFSYTASSFSGLWIYLVGGPGAARASQDVVLVAKKPTSALSRVAQEFLLVGKKPTSANARVAQDLVLAAKQPTNEQARLGQDVVLVAAKSSHVALFGQQVILVAVRNPMAVSQTATTVYEARQGINQTETTPYETVIGTRKQPRIWIYT